jgi:hypothetical protein
LVEVRRKRVTPQRVGTWLLVVGLALLLAGLGFRTWRIWRAARPLLERLDTIQALAADPATVDLGTVGPMLQEAHAGLVVLRDEAHPLLALTSYLGWAPGIGPDLQALPPLLDVAVDLTGAGETAMEGLTPLLSLTEADQAGQGEDLLSVAVHALSDARPQLEAARTLVEHAAQRRTEVDAAQLSPRLARLVQMLDRALPLAQAGIEAGLMAPDLLGASGPRTYLLLAQNSDELRPTGGFITAAGRVTVDDGSIIEFSFRDSYFIDDFSKPYDEPPAPLYEYMLSELWVFRDANWSPDFPTSARKAAELYTYGQGIEVDGVIAFDQQGAARLIEALGPVIVEGWNEPITGENFARMMRQAWAPSDEGVSLEWARTRKDFMGVLAQTVLERIKQQPETVDRFQLLQALWQILQERHLLIYLETPAAASWLRTQHWDGALRLAEGDYLMVVDANLGFNKVNSHVERALEYQVALDSDGGAQAVLALDYLHTGPGSDSPCNHRAVYAKGEQITYEGLMEGCYWNYLRVYVPHGSYLQSASRHPTPAEYLLRGMAAAGEAEALPAELSKAVFAQFFVVEPEQTLTPRFEYDLPRVAHLSEGQWRYSLLIQKQPGTGSTPVSLAISLPPGAVVLSATPPPRTIDGETLTFDLSLDTDVAVEVVYE